jgi:hypothetical protein
MTIAVPLSEALRRAVDRCFPPDERRPALDALGSVWQQPEATRQAIVILAYGDSTRLEGLVEAGKNDYRDVLTQLDERCGGLNTAEMIRRCRELGLSVPWPWSESLPEKIEADVKRFVAEELIMPFERVQTSMRLQEHLGGTEVSGVEFMEAFGKRFGVDLREFHPELHFADVDDVGLLSSLRHLMGRSRKTLPISVQDLVEAAQHKRFVSSVSGNC